MTEFGRRDDSDRKNFDNLIIQDGGGGRLEKSKNRRISATV